MASHCTAQNVYVKIFSMKDDAAYVPTKYDSVFWVDVERIQPNPYQPRREFSEEGLKSLAESIRQYGVLQPLVVSRTDVEKSDGGLESVYELIAGERRLRASRLVGLRQVPVVIRHGDSNLTKLELAIIENLQREDLNAIDRAKALQKLIDEFGISHAECAAKIGRSREYVSNSLRLLSLPEHMQDAIVMKEISEGHARPLMALNGRPEEQETLFKEIILRRLNVRSAERIARSIAQERSHKYNRKPQEIVALEKSLTETLGTRVIIETNAEGGCLRIDFFSPDDLQQLVDVLATEREEKKNIANKPETFSNTTQLSDDPIPKAAPEEPSEDEIYSVSNFTV
jgi:ParB family transcriptional regulator, chromosome partitioning protein